MKDINSGRACFRALYRLCLRFRRAFDAYLQRLLLETVGFSPQRNALTAPSALAVATKVAVRRLTLGLHDKSADFPLNRHQGAQYGRVQRRPIRILFRKLREITTTIQHPIPSSVRRSQAPPRITISI